MKANKPLISKEDFVKQIEYIKQTREHFEKLCDIMEELAPGFRVDFLPNLEFEAKIVELLNYLMAENPDDSLIEYFMYELEFGTLDTEPDSKSSYIRCNGKDYDISTAEKLYDTLCILNFRMKPQKSTKK